MQDVETVYAGRLKETRERLGLSQVRLAELLAEQAGIELDPTAITRIERGQRRVGLGEAHALASVLGVPLEYLCQPPPPASTRLKRELEVASIQETMAETSLAEAKMHAEAQAEQVAAARQRVKMLEAGLAAAREAEKAAAMQVGTRGILTLKLRSYNEVRAIAEGFRSGRSVIMDLTAMCVDDARRILDFSAGLIFALSGGIERVTDKVFMLTPGSVKVTAEDRARVFGARQTRKPPGPLLRTWSSVLSGAARTAGPHRACGEVPLSEVVDEYARRVRARQEGQHPVRAEGQESSQ